MKFDIKKVGLVFCLLCLMVTMTIPMAFAAGLTQLDLRTDDELTFVRYGYGVTNLYVDDGESLTFQYFLDNPKYSLTITHDYANLVKLIARSGQITLSSSGTTIFLDHDTVKGYIDSGKVTAVDDIAFYVDSNDASREYVFSISQSGLSKSVEVNTLLENINVAPLIWTLGSGFLAFCASEPMIMLSIGLAVISFIVMLIVRKVRGV